MVVNIGLDREFRRHGSKCCLTPSGAERDILSIQTIEYGVRLPMLNRKQVFGAMLRSLRVS
jgi:hypothetical protein